MVKRAGLPLEVHGLTPATMIEVEGLTLNYATQRAVDDLSFRIDQGEIVGFLGPNGAGKSSTLRAITGYFEAQAGRVRIMGKDVVEERHAAQACFGYLPENVPLYKEMRVEAFLRYRARLKGVPRKQISAAIQRALEQADVLDAKTRVIAQLSKGYQQRVGLADALLADPPVLILDEPTSGLDPNQLREVRALIKGFAGKKTVLLSTHLLSEVEASCERVIIIHQGKKVADLKRDKLPEARGALEELFSKLTQESEA